MESRRNDRLRALTRAAYTATAGHLEISPEDDGPGPVRRRWAPSARAALAAGAGVVALGAGLGVWALVGAPPPAQPLPGPDTTVSEAGDEGRAQPAGPGEQGPAEPAPAAGTAPSAGAGSATPGVVVVHVAGAVARPGVVELAAGARVGEAVDAAGGATPEAELAAVNLARLLVDGEQVYLPRVGEQLPGSQAGAGPAGPAGGGPGAAASDGGTGGGSGAPAGGAPVNLNTATAADLDGLPGVGPAIAERILQWRELNGPFTTVDDLDAVPGIGPATMERLRPLVAV
ncbi:helix-hairpin-helix domain-containing protein [Georgenia sp. AZ-5]|uniref:helix-hairpin-helix domain-containing protein n=1 Tax=Georgenia sp. AZ-5 TaxID=3367526 RepID=UPI0037550F9F